MAYTPSNFTGTDLDAFQTYVRLELERLSRSLQETIALDLRPVHREPDRPREGMIVYADGTDWNPGAGKGSYEFRGAAWFKL
jgi:hypothetical protein